MKRSLLYLLLATVVAGWIGTLIKRDPGYVLVAYDGASIQTGLWVMLALVFVSVFALYYFLRFLRVVGGVSDRIQGWGIERQRRKGVDFTSRGLIFLEEGEYERAEKFLVAGAEHYEKPVVNYLAAAKAANARSNAEQREAYLRLALEADSQATDAIALAAAEMAATRSDWPACLKQLDGLKPNAKTLRLQQQAYEAVGNWAALSELIPLLEKMNVINSEHRLILEKRTLEQRMNGNLSDEQLMNIYKKASEKVRADADITRQYCLAITNEKEAETTLRAAAKKNWHPKLVEAYGGLGKETLTRRLKTAQVWEKEQPNDAAVQLCLGELHELNGDREKAKLAFEKSIEFGCEVRASQHLANLLAFEGDFEKSTEYLRLALSK